MSVRDHMGLDDLLTAAEEAWPGWRGRFPQIEGAGDLAGFMRWLRSASQVEADAALLPLAQLAAVDGGNDPRAAAVLAWALEPGANLLARRLGRLSWDVDELVASHLWLQVCSFSWQTRTKVSANILWATRSAVQRDCETPSKLARYDPTWLRTTCLSPDRFACDDRLTTGPRLPDPAEELLELLEWACRHEVISPADRSLLLCLVEAADAAPARRTRGGAAGLLANACTEQVADRLGITSRQVRRRGRASIDALSRACAPGRNLA